MLYVKKIIIIKNQKNVNKTKSEYRITNIDELKHSINSN
jgi:hypothetical protein